MTQEEIDKLKQERDILLEVLNEVIPTIAKLAKWDLEVYDCDYSGYYEPNAEAIKALRKTVQRYEIEGLGWM